MSELDASVKCVGRQGQVERSDGLLHETVPKQKGFDNVAKCFLDIGDADEGARCWECLGYQI